MQSLWKPWKGQGLSVKPLDIKSGRTRAVVHWLSHVELKCPNTQHSGHVGQKI